MLPNTNAHCIKGPPTGMTSGSSRFHTENGTVSFLFNIHAHKLFSVPRKWRSGFVINYKGWVTPLGQRAWYDYIDYNYLMTIQIKKTSLSEVINNSFFFRIICKVRNLCDQLVQPFHNEWDEILVIICLGGIHSIPSDTKPLSVKKSKPKICKLVDMTSKDNSGIRGVSISWDTEYTEKPHTHHKLLRTVETFILTFQFPFWVLGIWYAILWIVVINVDINLSMQTSAWSRRSSGQWRGASLIAATLST